MRGYKYLSAKYSAEYFTFAHMILFQQFKILLSSYMFVYDWEKTDFKSDPSSFEDGNSQSSSFPSPWSRYLQPSIQTMGGAEHSPDLYSSQ